MTEDENIDEAKILLKYGQRKKKAQSWLRTALGDEPDDDSVDAKKEDLVPEIKASDELSGIGLIKKGDDVEDDLNARQLLSANEALRRRLLSKDGLKRYQAGQKQGPVGVKPLPRSGKVRRDVSDDEDEEQGRSTAVVTRQQLSGGVVKKSKTTRGSYLEEVLARRHKKVKQRRTPARNSDDD